jgi:tellurite resistance protein TehA-like permease
MRTMEGMSEPSRELLTTGLLGRVLDAIPPAVGAEVMATGIVSVGLSLDGQQVLSRVVLALAAAIWITLAALAPLRAVRDPVAFRADARAPIALNAAVATSVLGTRFMLLGWAWAGIAALVVAFAFWLALIRPALAGLKVPTVGASLLLAVTPGSLSALAASVARAEHERWLLIAAFVLLALGLAVYVAVISRFDVRQLAVGRGDHWVAGGALAISALAAATASGTASALAVPGARTLEDIALALWVLSMLWLLVLLSAEVRWPRLRYDARRWSTVFPVGMYAAVSFSVGAIARAPALTSFAQVWVWVAFAFWAIVAVTTFARVSSVIRAPVTLVRSPGSQQARHTR